MPTYDYECESCEHRFEVFQSMKDDPVKNCPECGGAVRRVVSGGAGIIYKGSGFYSTDKSAPKTASKPTACPAKDAKNSACASCPASA